MDEDEILERLNELETKLLRQIDHLNIRRQEDERDLGYRIDDLERQISNLESKVDSLERGY